MAGLNKATLIGNLGKDPEVRALNSGAKVATFSLATSESWTDKDTGEKKEHTDWHNVVVFNEHIVRVVEQYLAKGMKVYVEGQIKTRKWQDKDGQDRYTTEIVLQRFGGQLLMLSSKDGERRSGGRDDAYEEMDRERYGDRSRAQPRGGEVSSGRRGGSPNDSGHGDARKSKYADLDDEIPF